MSKVKICGVYCIQSKISPHKIYIGSSRDVRTREYHHFNNLRNNNHCNIKLSNHVKKYGIDDLDFFIILECEKDKLIENEQFYIDALNPFFNIRKIADSPLGTKMSEETRQKMRDRVFSEDHRRRISEANKGRKQPLDAVLRTANFNRGRVRTDEVRLKIKENRTGIKWSESSWENYSNSTYKKINSTSKFVGICFCKDREKWNAYVRINGKYINLGYYEKEIDAAIARDKYVTENGLKLKINFK